MVKKSYFSDKAVLLADQLTKRHQSQLIFDLMQDSKIYRREHARLATFDAVARRFKLLQAKAHRRPDEVRFCRIYQEKRLDNCVSPQYGALSSRRSAIAHPAADNLAEALYVLSYLKDGPAKEIAMYCARLEFVEDEE
jgi:hypothetical protein